MAEGALRAGAARVPILLEPGMSLAGYPARRHAQAGGETLYARALVVEAGGVRAGVQIVVALETMLVPGSLEEEVLRRAGLPPSTCLLLAATHTHSGPGGTWNNALAELAGNGRYDERERDLIAQAAAAAIAQATSQLGPARLSWAQAPWPEGPARLRSGGSLDTELTALQFTRPDGQAVAMLVDYAMHPTVEPRTREQPGADWPGRAAALFEERSKAPLLVLQGASGNASPDHVHSAAELGAAVAGHASELLAGAAPRETARLQCEVRLVALPPAQAGFHLPWPLRRGASNLLSLFAEPWTVQTRLQLADLELLGVPGEPVGALGLAARAKAGRPLALVGLADDYVGYIEEPARLEMGEGEAPRTYHGSGLAEALGL